MFGMQPPQMPYLQQMPQNLYSFPQPDMMNQGGQWGLATQTPFAHPQGSFGMDSMSSSGSMGSGFTPMQIPQTTGAPIGSVPPQVII